MRLFQSVLLLCLFSMVFFAIIGVQATAQSFLDSGVGLLQGKFPHVVCVLDLGSIGLESQLIFFSSDFSEPGVVSGTVQLGYASISGKLYLLRDSILLPFIGAGVIGAYGGLHVRSGFDSASFSITATGAQILAGLEVSSRSIGFPLTLSVWGGFATLLTLSLTLEANGESTTIDAPLDKGIPGVEDLVGMLWGASIRYQLLSF